MQNIIVTGGLGFIGSNLIELLLNKIQKQHIGNNIAEQLFFTGTLCGSHNLAKCFAFRYEARPHWQGVFTPCNVEK